jgi:hypothetical protein
MKGISIAVGISFIVSYPNDSYVIMSFAGTVSISLYTRTGYDECSTGPTTKRRSRGNITSSRNLPMMIDVLREDSRDDCSVLLGDWVVVEKTLMSLL